MNITLAWANMFRIATCFLPTRLPRVYFCRVISALCYICYIGAGHVFVTPRRGPPWNSSYESEPGKFSAGCEIPGTSYVTRGEVPTDASELTSLRNLYDVKCTGHT